MEKEWIKRAREGDNDALARLLYDSYEQVYRYMIKLTLNADRASDIVQDGCVKAVEKFHLYNPAKSKFSTWLITICRNIYMDSLRRHKVENDYLMDNVNKGVSDLITHDNDSTSRLSIIDSLIKLPEIYRVVVILRHYYGYSVKETSQIVKIPEGTVKSRLHSAIGILRKELL